MYTVSLLLNVSVVLLDTTTETSLEWTRYPYGPQARTPGVSVASFALFFRSDYICIGMN